VPARRRPVIELDNNPVERAIRPIALGRKNHLFAGSDGGGVRWATVCSLIATAKLNNVEPFTWLSDVLQRMTDGHPAIASTSSCPGIGSQSTETPEPCASTRRLPIIPGRVFPQLRNPPSIRSSVNESREGLSQGSIYTGPNIYRPCGLL
jgi:hypothetical protein